MKFHYADNFFKALNKLNSQEKSAAKNTVVDLHENLSAPGLQFHRIEGSKDPHFWSVRVNRDIRIVLHKSENSVLLCYVDHHDDAYKWAERRRIETHPKTGAVQVVEVPERVEKIAAPYFEEMDTLAYSVADTPDQPYLPGPFFSLSEQALLGVGVPEDWVGDIRQASEDGFLDIAEHLPAEASDALLEYVSTSTLPQPASVIPGTDPFEHPDAQRRFRVMENMEELERALTYPWEQWAIFLHPSQRRLVDRQFNGPARVSGSAGTGKTVVALHRAAAILQKDRQAKVLLTTFSLPLANALKHKLSVLTGNGNPNMTILPFEGVATELYTLAFGRTPRVANEAQVNGTLETAADELENTAFTIQFLASEWRNVIDAWQVDSLETYQNVPRIGRRSRISSGQRERAWPVFARTRELLTGQGLHTWPEIFGEVTAYFATQEHKPFTHIIVDEAQDLSVPELRLFAAMKADKPDALFFSGDIGQRIFQRPFSWKALGVDIRGRSHTLKVNYRTSHQIRRAADRLLPDVIRDVDGNEENRRDVISVFNGLEPEVKTFDDAHQETEEVAAWVRKIIDDGINPEEIGIFVRSNSELSRTREVVKLAGQTPLELSNRVEDRDGRISIGTMHLAKGLEFQAVLVMACDDDIVPSQARIETVADEDELDEVYETERHLFYVACTRARDRLLISGVKPESEFIEDFLEGE
ncbi:MAG: UvrD-helicase domain-containing protein [Gammaproteobacteria bacterium]|nr:UvrD-helicase domain-containing protein [Gammaproteobacteria bacterium]